MAKRVEDKFKHAKHDESNSRSERLSRVVPYKENSYEYDYSWIKAEHAIEAHSTEELIQFAESNPNIEIDARVLCATSDGLKHKRFNTKEFIEAYKSDKTSQFDFREYSDSFVGDSGNAAFGNALVGEDFIPLLGGPFNKQLYLTDYLRQHSIAFHAATHDPIGKRIINMVRQFVLGKGFRIEVTGGKDKDVGEVIIEALEEVNDLQQLMSDACTEISIYGEIMLWELPNNLTKIAYQVKPDQMPPQGILPRYRLIDPSQIWEIICYPEDVTRVIAYQWIAPTFYNIYSAEGVPTMKFIVQQLPADQVMHFKVNTVSGEKRGRSDLFPVVGYLKRLRDAVNYQIIADQKASAWAIDTTVTGSQTDLDSYASDQQSLGTIAPAGSEFIHTDKIKREYLANQGSARGTSNSFDWVMNMIASGCGIPISYFGQHGSQGQNRASALVGTEPVTKMFEERQLLLEKILRKIVDSCLKKFNLEVEYEVVWPELISQDRTAKLKDLLMVQSQGFLSKERVAGMIAKELGITEYDFDAEQEAKASEQPEGDIPNPLSLNVDKGDKTNKPSGISSEDKRKVSQNMGF